MIEFDVDPEALALPKRLTIAIQSDINWITAQALNYTMAGSKFDSGTGTRERNVKVNLEKNSKSFFANPKKQIREAWRQSELANSRKLAAGLNFKDKPFNRYRYFAPNIQGGKRKQKSFEKLLINHPLAYKTIPPNSQLVPHAKNFTSPLRIDKYGNVSRSSINYIYDHVSKSGRINQRESLNTKRRARKGVESEPTFLVGTPKYGGRPAGIWWRRAENKQLKLIFKAVEQTDYKPIYLAERTMHTTFKRLWKKNFETSYKKEFPHFF